MKKSKVLLYLASFSKSEMKDFEQFVASPYFNKRSELVYLLRYFAKYHPDFDTEMLTKQNVLNHMSTEKKTAEKELTYLMSFLFKLIEQFIQVSKFETDHMMKSYYLTQALHEKKLLKNFQSEIKKNLDLINATEDKGANYYLMANKFFDLQSSANLQRKHDENLKKAADFNDYYYFLTKLKYCASMIDRSSFVDTNYEIQFLEEVRTFLLKTEVFKDPIIAIYINIIDILKGIEPEEKFKLLKNQIFANSGKISSEEFKDIYIYAINFCLRQIKKNNLAYLEQVFELYREGIQKKILLNENGELTYWTYTNVVKAGLRLKDFELTRTFIFENKDKIPPKFREAAFNYNLSELNYYTNNYDEAHRLINFIKVDDSFIHAMSRITLCKIYFDTYNIEPLLSLLASFSISLKRDKKLSFNMKIFYKNFCDLLHQLLKKNNKKLPATVEKIKTITYISDREWLLKAAEKIQTDKKWKVLYY